MTGAERTAALVPYIRQSVEKEVTISLDEQRKKVRTWAEANGVDLLDEKLDEGVSSGKPWRERKLADILALVQAGRAGGVVVAYSSRLSRESLSAQHEIAEEFVAAGGRVVAIDRGIDTATAGWEYLFSMDAIEKKNALREYSHRWSIARGELVERGVHVTARVPVGYDWAYEQAEKDSRPVFDKRTGEPVMRRAPLVPNEHAPAVRELFEMRARRPKASWRQCTEVLESRGCLPPSGRWTSRAMSQVVRNRVYLGEIRYGDMFKAGAHPAIVDPAVWREAQTGMGIQGARKADPALLRGLAVCSGCKRPMGSVSGGTKEGARYRYMCRTNKPGGPGDCPAPASCYEDELDDLIDFMFIEVVGQWYETVATPDTEPFEQAVVQARADLDALVESIKSAPASVVAALVGAVEEKQKAVEAADDALRVASVGEGLAREAGTIQQRWPGLPKAEKTKWLSMWEVRAEVSKSERWAHPVEDRTVMHWSPEPLHPERVEPASLRDLYYSVKDELDSAAV